MYPLTHVLGDSGKRFSSEYSEGWGSVYLGACQKQPVTSMLAEEGAGGRPLYMSRLPGYWYHHAVG